MRNTLAPTTTSSTEDASWHGQASPGVGAGDGASVGVGVGAGEGAGEGARVGAGGDDMQDSNQQRAIAGRMLSR